MTALGYCPECFRSIPALYDGECYCGAEINPVSAEQVALIKRYVLDDQAPNNDVYGPERRYGVLDTVEGTHAVLPDATLCWGMTQDRALDALIELRGGVRAER